jgi:hypothetical protein
LRRVITPSDLKRSEPTTHLYVGGAKTREDSVHLITLPEPKTPVQVPDDYLTRVVKYVPAEIVAAFIAVDGILKSTVVAPTFLGWLVFVALWVLTPIYTWHFTTLKGYPPAYAQILISCAAFLVWVFALGGPFVQLTWYSPVYGSILLIMFTLIPPLVIGK